MKNIETPFQVQSVEITPEEAARLLDQNMRNRYIRNRYVTAYAKDIKEGKWGFSPQGISISNEGAILDGQHRLTACVEAGVPLRTMLFMDVPVDAVFDRGTARTAADELQMDGIHNAKVIAAWASTVIRWERTATAHLKVSTWEILDWYEENKAAVDAMWDSGATVIAKACPAVTSVTGAALFILRQIDEPGAMDFMGKLAYGNNLQKGDPELALRNWLLNIKAVRKHVTREELLKVIFSAWVDRQRGATRSIMKVTSGASSDIVRAQYLEVTGRAAAA